jgi:hypothetical protein
MNINLFNFWLPLASLYTLNESRHHRLSSLCSQKPVISPYLEKNLWFYVTIHNILVPFRVLKPTINP